MSITVPVQAEALVGREAAISRGIAVRATTAASLAQNAHHAYAAGGLRTAVVMRDLDLTGVTSYVVVAKVRFDFAAQRELIGLRFAYSITNADVLITIRDDGDTTDLQTANVTGTTATTGAISAPGSGNSAVIIKIEARRNSAAAASIDLIRIWEREHNASSLPG